MLQHIVLGALLQDIGKFVQRAQDSKPDPQNYAHWTADLLTPWEARFTALLGKVDGEDNFLTLATHSQPAQTPLQKLIAQANQMASAVNREPSTRPVAPSNFRLRSIFNRLQTSNNQTSHPDYYYKLVPLRFEKGVQQVSDTLFPAADLKVATRDEYAKLHEEFKKEWQELLKDPESTSSLPNFLPRLLTLLERYTWCIPAYPSEQADISLYDHSLVTAACAQALYLYHSEVKAWPMEYPETEQQLPKFLLISGDLSGMSSYLFHFATTNLTDIATILRARSFYIQQIIDIASLHLLEALHLLPVARIMNAGGRFLLIAPNTQAYRETFAQVQATVETWLYENFFGDLTLSLTTVEATAVDLMHQLPTTLDKLNDALDECQLQRFATVGPNYHWQMPESQWQHLQQHGVCAISGKFPAHTTAKSDQMLSATCQAQLEISQDLITESGFTYTASEDRTQGHFFNNQSLQFVKATKGYGLVYWLTEIKPDNKKITAKDGVRRFIANYVPKTDDGKLIEFDELIKRGLKRDGNLGLPRLAILKADVDNIELILNHGLTNLSLSQFTAMSRTLDLFFGGVLPELVKAEFPDTYIIHAGGDDLLVIGYWKDIIALSVRINQLFRQWCGQHPSLTLSAGITLIKQKYPIHRGADMATEALVKSKNYRDDQGNLVKNAVTVFETTVDWQELAELFGTAEQLNTYLRDDYSPLTTTFVHRLLVYHGLWQSMRDKGNVRGGAWKSRLCYDVARNLSYRLKNRQELRREGLFVVEQLMSDRQIKSVRIPLLHALHRNHTVKER
jgi:CRISPR-associated protein Csm1